MTDTMDGSTVTYEDPLRIETADGRTWKWRDLSYRDADTGWNTVSDGVWEEA